MCLAHNHNWLNLKKNLIMYYVKELRFSLMRVCVVPYVSVQNNVRKINVLNELSFESINAIIRYATVSQRHIVFVSVVCVCVCMCQKGLFWNDRCLRSTVD